jgi:hypothetical protein
VHIDDLKNPEYRKGRRNPPQKAEPVRRAALSQEERRAKFAVAAARAEFGKFYWNDDLGRRMERELQKSRRLKREAEQVRRRKRNGARA